ncbi:hypothetical protein HHI36_006650 [Cryptolaemus montrouzieri]|uniref:N-acetyltransferase domain-containing protein n=1 Tax=Cryptolaemus montrouzieri TaxID=559131 RepID=A0ABD2NYQ9_9CUCU
MDINSSHKTIPSVWKTFERTINGQLKTLWIQDFPEDQFEVALDYLQKYFFRDEPMTKALKILEDEIATKSFREIYKMILMKQQSLACFTKLETGEIKLVALNCCMKKYKEEPEDFRKYIKGENLKKLLDIVEYVEKLKDPFETLNISEYLGSLALLVIPEYRGHNIGFELLCARKPLSFALGLKATITTFTAPSSQRSAEKAGFKDLTSFTYDEIEERNADFKIPKINDYSKRIRFMYILYE